MMCEKLSRPVRRRGTAADGFTLVEMLAAVALLAILAWIVFYVFMSAQTVSSNSNALREAHQVARGILKVMQSDISGAWLRRDQYTNLSVIPPRIGLIFYSDKNSELDDKIDNPPALKETTNYWDVESDSQKSWDNDGLVLLTTVSPAGGEDRCQAKVMYVLKENGDLLRGVQFDEVLDDLDYSKATAGSEGNYVIGRGVTVLQFRFLSKDLDGGKWWDYWEDIWKDGSAFERYLPGAVEVRLRVRDRKGLIKSKDDVEGEVRLGVWFTQVIAIPGAQDWP